MNKGILNTDKMISSNQPYSCLLIPCFKENSNKKLPKISGLFEIENKPMRINTILFIGSFDKLKKSIKNRENVNLTSLENENPKKFGGITIPCEAEEGHSFVLIWMPEFDWSLEDFETLSHECLHATIMVLRMSGVKPKIFSAEDDSEVDDEIVAYTSSSMFKTLVSELTKKESKLFKKAINNNKK